MAVHLTQEDLDLILGSIQDLHNRIENLEANNLDLLSTIKTLTSDVEELQTTNNIQQQHLSAPDVELWMVDAEWYRSHKYMQTCPQQNVKLQGEEAVDSHIQD
ncbi:uncharacterized protein PSFLO_06783 [Pseudozyma flocculosa]|uniref:Uncharacterized protein n=1 Tax=Pseudozyma flocculosa TaxID=84751 RepID=A0A5C3FCV1_9BASI|nr:uncharacterized protein PSFLO_06783 [Pseudozyma flocculosa]